jgi:hypothetical protein
LKGFGQDDQDLLLARVAYFCGFGCSEMFHCVAGNLKHPDVLKEHGTFIFKGC